jgi:CRP-like cAMP-binding protein
VNNDVFPFLTAGDWDLWKERARLSRHVKGDRLVREGDPLDRIAFLRSGRARVERETQGMRAVVAHLGPGDIFGEMSFVENTTASASVVVDEDAEVLTLSHESLRSLIESVPGLSTRFYQSLATLLSRRLRESASLVQKLNVGEVAQINRFHAPRTGHLSERQVPAELIGALDAWHRNLWKLRQGPSTVDLRPVAALCDEVCALLERFTDETELVEAGMTDLLAFRDISAVTAGIGAYVFRETFSTLMSSTTMARCYMHPLGYPDDHETMLRIYRATPEGDGRLGPLVDEWFLGRPICKSRRASAKLVADQLAQAMKGDAVPITVVASGAATEVVDVLSRAAGARGGATCVDIDERAAVAASELGRAAGLADRLAFMVGNVQRMAEGRVSANLAPQRAVSALGLAEYLEDDAVVTLLDWMHGALEPGGLALLSNLGADNPDRLLMQHVLEWQVRERTREDLRALASRSRFGQDAEVVADGTGLGLLLLCRKSQRSS